MMAFLHGDFKMEQELRKISACAFDELLIAIGTYQQDARNGYTMSRYDRF
jgi:hypothetical protein